MHDAGVAKHPAGRQRLDGGLARLLAEMDAASGAPADRATAHSSSAVSGSGSCRRTSSTSARLPRKKLWMLPRTLRLATRIGSGDVLGQLCLRPGALVRAGGAVSSGLPKPMKGCVALLALANWRRALSEATEGSTVMACRLVSQAALA